MEPVCDDAHVITVTRIFQPHCTPHQHVTVLQDALPIQIDIHLPELNRGQSYLPPLLTNLASVIFWGLGLHLSVNK